jgi:hypothetical protein
MIYQTILSGLIGSIAMLAVLYLITLSRIANADMVRALGSLVTKRLENSFGVGLIIYLLGGILFSFLYFFIFQKFPRSDPGTLVFVGTFGGFIHGGLVSFALIISVSEWHPLPRFQKVGFEVALAHIVGHIAYGATLALAYLKLVQGASILPADGELGAHTIYVIVLVVFGIVFTGAAAAVSHSHRKNKDRTDRQQHQHLQNHSS